MNYRFKKSSIICFAKSDKSFSIPKTEIRVKRNWYFCKRVDSYPLLGSKPTVTRRWFRSRPLSRPLTWGQLLVEPPNFRSPATLLYGVYQNPVGSSASTVRNNSAFLPLSHSSEHNTLCVSKPCRTPR
ncbi:hypothetical protein CDAR_400921 [Caerostris darwini]|uniref:Uncharacterized protein n=1 Tax=Caerostris darwini TaxID=1538125 RepID=A0AAV4TL21_9ARAC|nr:hypothetical protein CDAR_400921 [Caerostris darwini]